MYDDLDDSNNNDELYGFSEVDADGELDSSLGDLDDLTLPQEDLELLEGDDETTVEESPKGKKVKE
jgi:hypothetical protein